MTETTTDLAKDGAVSVKDAEAFLGVGRTTIYELMTTGQIRYFKIGSRRLILREELRRFLAAQASAK